MLLIQEQALSKFPICSEMLSCAGAYRLQTGMRGVFGKPQGTCARVSIGQVLPLVRCKDSISQNAQKALRRAKFKFLSVKRLLSAGNGDLPSSVVLTISSGNLRTVSCLMVLMPRFLDTMDVLQTVNLEEICRCLSAILFIKNSLAANNSLVDL